MAKTINYEKRLAEIADITLGVLSDEEVLHLLAERKQLQELQEEYVKLKQEQEASARAEEEKSIRKELIRLNKLITSDKPDDELIHLIEERKIWEAKMEALEKKSSDTESGEDPPEIVETADLKKTIVAEVPAQASVSEEIVETEVPTKEAKAVSKDESRGEGLITGVAVNRDFGREKVVNLVLDEKSEFYPYLEEIKRSPASVGRILEGVPSVAKKDKLFMFEVAKIDPAYAMHYADKDTLKKDDDFNLRVASLKNERNSGSALSEMLPEARTAKVVMAAIRADYRNIRFALPQMEGYDDMFARAKSGALQKVKELKESVDVALLVPKILQKDKEFMKQVEKLIPQSDE